MDAYSYKLHLLEQLYKPYDGCKGCHFKMPLATQIVWGSGTPEANLMFVGEAPGRDEDLQGKPFVGRSGKLLDKIFQAGGISRDDIFITNIVKIRPPNNRRPFPAEITLNKPLLLNQIKIIRPKVICTLGSAALEGLLGKPVKISQLRGKTFQWDSLTVIPTFHPAYILRNSKELETLVLDIEKAIKLAQ